jgi:hypothetical protein
MGTFHHRMQSSRFELKYVIQEPCALAIRDFLRAYLVADEHADPRNGNQYPVHSVYCDNGNYALYKSTTHGHKNRFKLRCRFYNEKPKSAIFFEIKARHTDVILKQRAAVKRSSVQNLLAGHWPSFNDLAKDPDDFGPLQRFCSLSNMLNACGKVLVSYMREAYVTPNDNSVRVTFDRNLETAIYRGDFSMKGMAIRPVYVPGVVLEIKFTDAFPIWLREMVRVFDLERGPFAKYVTCIEALHRFELMMSPSYQEVIG